jgi:hypothetical protein
MESRLYTYNDRLKVSESILAKALNQIHPKPTVHPTSYTINFDNELVCRSLLQRKQLRI